MHGVFVMENLRIKRRHRLKTKEVKRIFEELAEILGLDNGLLEGANPTVDLGHTTLDFEILFVNGKPLAWIIDNKPFLTVRGLLEYQATKRNVVVDMGAVKFVCNGADVMAPGIVDADTSISTGDLVWISDEKNRKPLAIGIALMNGTDMIKAKAGKAVRSLHHVGDELWELR